MQPLTTSKANDNTKNATMQAEASRWDNLPYLIVVAVGQHNGIKIFEGGLAYAIKFYR